MGCGTSLQTIEIKVWPVNNNSIIAPVDDGETVLDTLVVLTWNVGLMRIQMCGKTVFSNPPFVEERARHIAPSILSHEPDVIALQECYELEHINMLIDALSSQYPFNVHVECNKSFKKDPGLVLLSRFPIQRNSVACIPHRHSSVGEDAALAAKKSMLLATVRLPGHPPLQLVNMHTTYTEKTRQGEMNEGMALALEAEARGHPSILLGDLNCGPLHNRDGLSDKTLRLAQAGDAVYRTIPARGFTDAFSQGLAAGGKTSDTASDAGADVAQEVPCTWDPKNYLNAGGVHDSYPPERLDHVMCGPLMSSRWQATAAQVVMTERVVSLPGSVMSSPSDHYGVLVTLHMRDDVSDT